MDRDCAIELLTRMKRHVVTDDLDTTIRVSDENDAIDVAVRDITFIKGMRLDRKLPEFGRWKQVPSGMTPGGTPMYACSICGGSEHLYGTEFPRRKVLCNDCGSVNFYPWEKLADPIIPEEENKNA